MFTGLVEGIGRVKEIRHVRDDMRLSVVPLFDMSDSRTGDSISINGVCLTITSIQEGVIHMDVSGETISRSTMSRLQHGDDVNMERALLLTDRLGGHLVSGHVDGTGKILKKEQGQSSLLLQIGINEALSRYTIEKGSIAVDGISLTINRCKDTFFEVNIIPETTRITTILLKKVGDVVNIETDLIGKYLEKFFREHISFGGEKKSSVIDEKMLKKYGFSE
ncbi:MAG: riboflavin synthase [Thermodesulfobacteriota bacterium]|nr:riboflavin synthase [Thermodesulfobacteriota bacterium]